MDNLLILSVCLLYLGVTIAAFARARRAELAAEALADLRAADAIHAEAEADFALVLAGMVRDLGQHLIDLDGRVKAVEGAIHEVSTNVRDRAVANWTAASLAHNWNPPTN